MLGKITLALATVISGFALASPVAAHTFATIDCIARLNAAETRICSSQHLQVLDAWITEKYAVLMNDRRRAPDQHEALRDSQYEFLSRRDRCGGSYRCLHEVMSLRAIRIDYYR